MCSHDIRVYSHYKEQLGQGFGLSASAFRAPYLSLRSLGAFPFSLQSPSSFYFFSPALSYIS